MRQKPGTRKSHGEKVVKDIRRATRGLFTWALLTEDAERRFVNGDGLLVDEWNAGDRFWIVDLIAPYRGIGTMMSQWIRKQGNVPTHEFSFLRVSPQTKKPTKIVRVNHNGARPLNPACWVCA